MNDATLKVKSLKGTQCPKEGAPREYISDDKAEDVPATMYYRRLIDDGSLIVETPVAKKTAAESPKK